ncbi:TetR/AcrR family transcriptional regulator [Nocardia sp. NPDC127526]|uniref:TetR/AcrR family transcriptional regulator n=1 Tax=Nocardia sp. NPDC127526 TaxID=3345393 RepID=UPI00362F56DF
MAAEAHQKMLAPRVDGRFARGERKRQQLLDAALRVAEREGVAALTHRAVAKEAGLPATAGTYYFPTIRDLFNAVIETGLQQFSDEIAARLGDAPGVREFAEFAENYTRENRERLIVDYELYLLAGRKSQLRPTAYRWITVMRPIVASWTTDQVALKATLAAIDGIFIQAVADTPPTADAVERVLRHTLR